MVANQKLPPRTGLNCYFVCSRCLTAAEDSVSEEAREMREIGTETVVGIGTTTAGTRGIGEPEIAMVETTMAAANAGEAVLGVPDEVAAAREIEMEETDGTILEGTMTGGNTGETTEPDTMMIVAQLEGMTAAVLVTTGTRTGIHASENLVWKIHQRPPNGPPPPEPDAPPPRDSNVGGEIEEGEDMEEDEEDMMAAMGFGGFDTLQGKSVNGNQQGAANVKKQRTWRQYMNRKGGFNRPLDKVK
ncbi:hypothetical protein AG1IA_01222 [Rhizoctonia solani AG-1 IA]|uniref:U4/U6.U5 small nuclear ribonucleoprotein 27kDa protein domain-containing protein n=1 Tax=Thanatephorus cucumeris (strain AG1-IA) TaxID=983506 RepID=L8X371_THACA|nr:hypothetical protein AG1IA_01222 [Rhizoctonia solani AG-1 IA]